MTNERAFVLLIATALRILVDQRATVANQPPLKKTRGRPRKKVSVQPPERTIPDLGLDLGDGVESAFEFLQGPRRIVTPPPTQDDRPLAGPKGYAPSRENDEAGTSDSLPWTGAPN